MHNNIIDLSDHIGCFWQYCIMWNNNPYSE